MFTEKMNREHRRLEKEIASLQAELSSFPEGKLICCSNGNYTKWYRSDGHKSTYLSKNNLDLARQLAVKKYLEAKLEELHSQKDAIAAYLCHRSKKSILAENLLSEDSPYSQLLSSYFRPQDPELKQWMTQPYQQNPAYPEHLIHKTSAGFYVRSKSEALIAMLLHTNRIPFRYECALSLGETTLYPDFTIRHPETGEFFYWEHFGMMDQPAYAKHAFAKLELFTSNGILPSVHLLTTFETMEQPLDLQVAEGLIKMYFL